MCSVAHGAPGEAEPDHAGKGIDLNKSLSSALSLTRRASVSIGISGLRELSKSAANALAKQAAAPAKPGLTLDLPDEMAAPKLTPRLARRASLMNGRSGLAQPPSISEEDLDANPMGGLFPIQPVTGHDMGLETGPVTITALTSLADVIAWKRRLDERCSDAQQLQ